MSAPREQGLHKSLGRAQIVMIGLGGAIGTGLFAGSTLAIAYAGPAVLVSYLIAGFIAVVMVLSLSEMAVMLPAAGSFGVYAETYLNPWAGFVVRYTYWAAQVIAVGAEAVAVGAYMDFWFPGVPAWTWSVGFAAVLLYVNSRAVRSFGTFEYWFALIKVIAIVVFIILGVAAVCGVGTAPVGLHNVTGLPGGFMPKGLHGVWTAVILGVLSFNGIEVVAVTSGEAADPRTSIPAALRTMVLRLLLFYLLGLFVVIAFAPWTTTGSDVVTASPFVQVLRHSGIAQAAGIMNFVVITAALSSMNTDIYLCSRMLFSLARSGHAPESLGRLSREGTPIAASLVSGAGILVAAAMSMLTPKAFTYLFGVALFGAMIVWMIILLSHLSFRRRHPPQSLPVRMPLFPYMQIAGLVLLSALLVTMGLEKDWSLSWICGLPWLGLLSAGYLLRKRRFGARKDAAMASVRDPAA
jgi:L-asparagine transporter-like permease